MNPRSLASLTPPPSFRLLVKLPVPGRAGVVEMRFRTRTRTELAEFAKELAGMTDEAAIAAVAEGWNLADEFNAESIAALCEAVPGAGHAIVQAYLRESTGAEVG